MDFFITGFARSGTTLLSVILNSHPEIHVGKKTLVHSLVNLGDNYLGAADFEVKEPFHVNKLFSNSLNSEKRWKPFHSSFLQSNHLQASVAEATTTIKERESVSLLGDKIPLLTYRIPDINLLFPNAKYICLIRDPRSVVNSHKERLHNSPLLTAYRWKKFMLSIEYYKKILGGARILLMTYEELIQDTKPAIEKICTFLNIDFEPSMIELHHNQQLQSNNSYVGSYFDTSKINDWEQKLSSRSIRQVERMTGDLMQTYEYERKFSPEKKLLSQRIIYREEFFDKVNYLKNSEVEGMVDQKITKRKISLISRIIYFGKTCLLMVFSDELISALNAKTKIFNPYSKRF